MRILRIVLAIVVLAGLFYFVGFAEMSEVFFRIEPLWLICFVALAVVMVWASCLKWQLFIREGGNSVPIVHLMKLYFVGYFFNTFTPSTVGGDVARSFHLGKYLANQGDALIATFLERFTGLLAMSMLGVLFLALGAPATAGLSAAILSIAALTGLLAAICFSETIACFSFSLARNFTARFVPGRLAEKCSSMIAKVDTGMRHARDNKVLLAKALLLSLFFHCLTVLNTYLGARAVGWHNPDIAGLFVVVPLVLLVSMAPITPSGLGIQEGAFLFFLQRIGGTHAQGLGVGMVLRAKVILLGLVGGLVWLHVRGQAAGLGRTTGASDTAEVV